MYFKTPDFDLNQQRIHDIVLSMNMKFKCISNCYTQTKLEEFEWFAHSVKNAVTLLYQDLGSYVHIVELQFKELMLQRKKNNQGIQIQSQAIRT